MSRKTGRNVKSPRKAVWLLLSAFFMFVFTGVCGCAGTEMAGAKWEGDMIVLDPPAVPVDQDRLEPGISVWYLEGFWRHLGQMPDEKSAKKRGVKGKPIPYLNHSFGEGIVFGSGRGRGVGLYMRAFIRFETPGVYEMAAMTNDGFRLEINGAKILEDPSVHSDRLTGDVRVKVVQAGWYPARMQYFQRKGTSTLKLFWKKSGDAERSAIPPEAYAHIPESV